MNVVFIVSSHHNDIQSLLCIICCVELASSYVPLHVCSVSSNSVLRPKILIFDFVRAMISFLVSKSPCNSSFWIRYSSDFARYLVTYYWSTYERSLLLFPSRIKMSHDRAKNYWRMSRWHIIRICSDSLWNLCAFLTLYDVMIESSVFTIILSYSPWPVCSTSELHSTIVLIENIQRLKIIDGKAHLILWVLNID